MTPSPRWPAARAAGLFLVATLVFEVVFESILGLRGNSDLSQHIEYARQIHTLRDLLAPHFLFQLLVNAGYVLGVSRETTAVWLLGACYGGMAVLIGGELSRRNLVSNPFAVFGLVMAVLMASHLFAPWAAPYHGYLVPTAYHNPTQQLNKLFAVWIYFLYHREFLGDRPARAWLAPVLAVLCVLSAVAKPSFLIAFLPAAALYGARDLLRRRWRQALLCLAGIGVPTVLAALWQSKLTADAGQTEDILFRPFVVFDAVETAYKLPVSLAFPLVVGVGAWWTRTSAAGLRFVWVLTAVALFATLGLVESGARMMHGNFAWTGQTAVFLVYVESVLFLLSRPPRPWTRAAWVLFALHVAFGVMWYRIYLDDSWARMI